MSKPKSSPRKGKVERMQRALQVLAIALKEPDGGSYHPARSFLDKHGIYHDDLEGTRVLLRVAQIGLNRKVAR